MLYILDANVLIDANRDYYSIGRVPEFWDWLVNSGENGVIKIPIEVYEEIRDGKKTVDLLATWAQDAGVRDALLLQEDVVLETVAQIVNEGYAVDLDDSQVEQIGRDPFLIAYAMVAPVERCIVTTEASKPSAKRQNRHLPDVCDQFGIKHCHTYDLIRELDFKTKWRP